MRDYAFKFILTFILAFSNIKNIYIYNEEFRFMNGRRYIEV